MNRQQRGGGGGGGGRALADQDRFMNGVAKPVRLPGKGPQHTVARVTGVQSGNLNRHTRRWCQGRVGG